VAAVVAVVAVASTIGILLLGHSGNTPPGNTPPAAVATTFLYDAVLSPGGNTLYLSGTDKILALDPTTGRVLRRMPVRYGGDLAVSPDGRRLAVGSGPDVLVIDSATGATVAQPITGADKNNPFLVAFSPDGERLYVSSPLTDTVLTYSTSTSAQALAPVRVGDAPAQLAVSPDGKRLYVVNSASDSVSVVDTAKARVVGTPISVPSRPFGPSGLTVSRDGKWVYVGTSRGIAVIDTAKRLAVGTMKSDFTATRLVAAPDGTRLYAGAFRGDRVTAFDTATFTEVDRVAVTEPNGLALDKDGRRLSVAGYSTGTVSVLDTATLDVVGTPIRITG
jgi:YVTN family beta-propeller protein